MSAKNIWHISILSACLRVHLSVVASAKSDPWFSFPFGQVYRPDVGTLRAAAKMVIANSARACLLFRPSARAVFKVRAWRNW